MRYTTLIDITELPQVYSNHNARLLYLHMALKAGYHDDDRDQLAISIRRLAMDCGLTVSATRHALAALTKAGLLRTQDGHYSVTKWVAVPPPTPRTQAKAIEEAKRKAAANDTSLSASLAKMEAEGAEFDRLANYAARTCTKEQLLQWADELEAGRRVKHCGLRLSPNLDNIKWLRDRAAEK